MASTPTSAPGSRPAGRPGHRGRTRGFTLVELLVVVALVAVASGLVAFSIRDPAAARLEQEAVRLSALLESARAEARGLGLRARWEPLVDVNGDAAASGFRFVGLLRDDPLPSHWLSPGVTAQVIGARAVPLGPEPLIGPQRIVLRLDAQQLVLATDGLAPFSVVGGAATAAP